MRASRHDEQRSTRAENHEVQIEIGDGFMWESLTEACAELGVTPAELAGFAILYYLADLDSDRVARQIPSRSPRLRGLHSGELPGA